MLNSLYSNLSGDFTATVNAGAKTITFSSYASTILSSGISTKSFLGASIKRVNTSGQVDTLPLTSISFTSNVLTLADMTANFVSGDAVAVVLIGPDKGFDETNDLQKTAIVSSAAITDGTKSVTTAGTRVALVSSATPCKSIVISAKLTNTGVIVVGGTTVVAASSARQGIPLMPGDTVQIDINDANKINLDATVNGEGVTYFYLV